MPYRKLSLTLDASDLTASTERKLQIPGRIVQDILMAMEVGIVIGAAVLAEVLYLAAYLGSAQALQPYTLAGLMGEILTQVALRSWGLHSVAAVREWRRHIGSIVAAVSVGFLILVAIAFLLKVSANYSRVWLLIWYVLVLVLLTLGRSLAALVLVWLGSSGHMIRRIAVVASGPSASQIVAGLRATLGVRVVGTFTYSESASERSPAQGGANLSDLISIGQRNLIDEIVVDLAHVEAKRIDQLFDQLGVLPVEIWLCASHIRRPVLAAACLGSFNLLQVKPKPIREWGALVKTSFDYCAGFMALILLTPLMLAIAVAIKLDSPGKVFFRQRRHGYNHRVIDVYKFRTMYVAENGDRVNQARKNDPRVTKVGKFLRRTSLDELPQLFNVLRGEMSLVGPRPHALAHNKLYGDMLARYDNRHCVKPGITGWAQIHGYRGLTDDPEKMRRRVEFDLQYIENWSPLLDLRILMLTPFLGLLNENAY